MITLTPATLALVLDIVVDAIRPTNGSILDILEELEEPYAEESYRRHCAEMETPLDEYGIPSPMFQ